MGESDVVKFRSWVMMNRCLPRLQQQSSWENDPLTTRFTNSSHWKNISLYTKAKLDYELVFLNQSVTICQKSLWNTRPFLQLLRQTTKIL